MISFLFYIELYDNHVDIPPFRLLVMLFVSEQAIEMLTGQALE